MRARGAPEGGGEKAQKAESVAARAKAAEDYSGCIDTVQRAQRLQRARSTHIKALAQLWPYTAVGLRHQVVPRACGRLAEAVLGRGA